MNITIKDVAKEAGVSTSTVSRVLSNSKSISEDTKKKVMEVVKKMDYKPNLIARGLAKNKKRMIGVVIPNDGNEIMTNYFFVSLMKGISMCAQSNDYYVSYTFSKDMDDEKSIKDMCDSGLVDGMCILRSKEDDNIKSYLKNKNFPFVTVGRENEDDNMLWVDNNNFKISYDVVDEMIAKGNRNIFFLGARENFNVSKDRFKGYKLALEMNGLKINEKFIINANGFTREEGYNFTKKIVLENEKIDAIFATDDLLAIGAAEYLNEKDINDISIVGFNNIPLGEFQKKPISTVDINSEQLGYRAAELLINKLEGRERKETNCIVKCKLIKRKTFV